MLAVSVFAGSRAFGAVRRRRPIRELRAFTYDAVVEQQDSANAGHPRYAGYTWSEGWDRPKYSSPERSVEYALVSVAVLLAPDGYMAVQLARLVDNALNDPEYLQQTFPDWLGEPYRSQLEFARTAIRAGLAGGMWGVEQFLVLCDWRECAEDIHEKLRRVPTRPAMSWDEPPGPFDGPAQLPDDADTYLRETARQSREAGMALIRITMGDSYELGFVPLNRTALLVADATVAGFTYENDCFLEIVKS